MSKAIVASAKKRPAHEYLSIDWEVHDGLLTAAVRVRHTVENTDEKIGWTERMTNVFACEDMPMSDVARMLLTKQPLLIRTQNGMRKLSRTQVLALQGKFFIEGEKSAPAEQSIAKLAEKQAEKAKARMTPEQYEQFMALAKLMD